MFWLRNKKSNDQLHTLIWGPVICIQFFCKGFQQVTNSEERVNMNIHVFCEFVLKLPLTAKVI